MQHRVTIRANRPQVIHRIDLIRLANLRQRLDMVHVDEPPSDLPVDFLEVEAADLALGPPVVDTRPARRQIPLESVDEDCHHSPLHIHLRRAHFLRRPLRVELVRTVKGSHDPNGHLVAYVSRPAQARIDEGPPLLDPIEDVDLPPAA